MTSYPKNSESQQIHTVKPMDVGQKWTKSENIFTLGGVNGVLVG